MARRPFGPFTLTSAGHLDIFVAKYDGNGNELWARSAGGTSGEMGWGIAVDAAGNSYVTGFFNGTATFGPFTLTGGGNFVAKYDSTGSVLWVQSTGGYGIAVDGTGNSFVTGAFQGTVTFGPFTLISAGSADIFVAEYDGGGNVLWARSAGGTEPDRGLSIVVDAAGNSYVTGEFSGTASFGAFTLTSAGDRDIFVAGYDGGGNVLWARSGGGTLWDAGHGIAIDGAGNSYVTGAYRDTATFGPFTLTSPGGIDVFVAKYNTCGNGSVDPGEECDDAGESATCNADCTGTECGDGTPNVTAGEECDDGGESTTCDIDCTFAECGDGTPNVTAGEECDDGPDNSDTEPDACRTDCTAASCGDGVVDSGEECDDGNTQPGDGCDEKCRFDLGACCVGTACSITTEADCLDSAGSLFGFNSTCDVPDADGDGLRDECDECPNDPNKIQPGICGCNVDDDADGDGDGVPDCTDQCGGVDDAVFAPHCEDAIPTVSEWGLVVMALLLLAGAKVYFGRKWSSSHG